MLPERRLHIAYVLTPVIFGGLEKVSLTFLENVDRSWYQIHPILILRPWEDEPFFSIQLRRMGFSDSMVALSLTPTGGPLSVAKVAWQLFSALKSECFDIVHTHGYFANICGLPAARLLRKKTISTCHGYISNNRRLFFYNELDKLVLRLCGNVIAVSDSIKHELSLSGVCTHRIKVLPNAVHLRATEIEMREYRKSKRKDLNLSSNDRLIGYLGRVSKEKGLRYLIDAVAQLIKGGKRLKLLIVGEGPDERNLEEQVSRLNLGSKVIFAGFQKSIEPWLASMDLFVLPSLTEGTPMALLEAMSAGLPVVASAVGGIPKIITDRVNGILTAPGDCDCLRDGILSIIDDTEFRNSISMNGSKAVSEGYGVRGWCRAIEQIYLNVHRDH